MLAALFLFSRPAARTRKDAAALRVVIIGGGIVGLAAAYALTRAVSSARVVLLEKELALGLHQTGRNSGVIHSGIYYRPGSLKALTCQTGRGLLLDFCRRHSIEHQVCGKLIVATREEELAGLNRLASRAAGNGVSCAMVEGAALRRLEPHVAGLRALHVKDAGIVDYRRVAHVLAEECGADIRLGVRALATASSSSGVVLQTSAQEIEADYMINCAGLHCDRVCRDSGSKPEVAIVAFKGEYYRLSSEAEPLCRNLIYPVPDPAFPFLGVHLTRMVGGGVEVGPNAVLALGREAYRDGDLNFGDLAQTLSYPGFWRLAARHWRQGLAEARRSLSLRAFLGALQRLVPELAARHLSPAPCGIRAQAVRSDGTLQDDFLLRRDGRCLHVLNAPSPAATSSLAIGERVAAALLSQGR